VNAREFARELSRRKVVRAAIFYAVVAWVLIQLADVIFPALALPDWTIRLFVILVILGFPLAMFLSWFFDLTPDGVTRTDAQDGRMEGVSEASKADGPAAAPVVGAAPSEKSIAVLPFVDMSEGRDSEYFSDGVTEEILNALVRVRHLHVASRTSAFAFKGKDLDIRTMAEELNVATVLEGSVRKAGNRLRITAQLINATDGYHLWSETYDRELEDVFQVQDEIARSIVEALKVQLDMQATPHLVTQATANMDAYTLYLKGRYVYNKFRREDLQQSLTYYEQALQADPTYARAYGGIADSWMSLADDWYSPEEAYPKAKASVERAIQLDDSLAEAHTAIGKVLAWFEWDFQAAELALRRAVARSPSYAEGHYALASALPSNGNLEEGLAEMREALALDPLSSEFSGWVARFLLYSRRLEEAIEQCQETIRLDPQYYYAHVRMGNALLAMGKAEEALNAFREQATRTGDVVSVRAYEAQALAVLGRDGEAREILESLENEERYVRPEFLAGAYGALGEMDRAFEKLEEAYASRSAGLVYLHIDPAYDSLHGDPRFKEMVERVGLADRRPHEPRPWRAAPRRPSIPPEASARSIASRRRGGRPPRASGRAGAGRRSAGSHAAWPDNGGWLLRSVRRRPPRRPWRSWRTAPRCPAPR
jgi:serine/threonine-protein kinase